MSAEPLENLEELARRAVACKRWRWMPGMRYQVGGTVGRLSDSQCKGKLPLVAETRPDLSDPATLGCLLALVREAHGAPAAYFMGSVNNQWVVHHFTEPEAYWKSLTKWQPTEAEALVAALEVAP
jgi:hypothetical protein